MMGLIEYALAGTAAAAVAWGGYQTVNASIARADLESAQHALAVSQGRLNNCTARLTNIQEAEASNAEIPDDLLDFDIPDAWRVQPEGADTGPH